MHAPLTVDLKGKVALVTGATAGLGKEIARGLARLGAEVILPARSLERGEAARKEIVASTGNPNVTVMKLDIASLESIRAFVAHTCSTSSWAICCGRAGRHGSSTSSRRSPPTST